MAKTPIITYIMVVAVLAIGYWAFTQPSGTVQIQPAAIDNTGQPVGEPSAGVAKVSSDRGTISFANTNSGGTTGTAGNLLLLDPTTHAIMKDGKLDKEATRYALMKIHQEKGLDGMKAFSSAGAPTALSASSGTWSATVTGKVGDKILVYTYQDTTPTRGENISTVNLVALTDFYRETGTWVAENEEGKDAWQLYNYGAVNFTDATDTNRSNYTYFDAGSADTDKTITFYSKAMVQGEECVDCAVYMTAPSNYTSRFKKLTVTDNFGTSVSFDAIAGKAENFVGPVNTASTVLAAPPTDNYIYYIGKLDGLNTLYTSSDANRLTWVLKTDTYGEAGRTIQIKIHVVQNAGALIKNNGVFQAGGQGSAGAGSAGYPFIVNIDGGTTGPGGYSAGFDVVPTSQ